MAHIEISGLRKKFTAELLVAAIPPVGNPLQAEAIGKTIATEMARGIDSGTALSGVDLDIPEGRVTVILGPSGSGKSTLLRCIAGLEKQDSGSIKFDGKETDILSLPPDQRGIGMVFQDYALYPHMKAKSNILSAFIFKKQKPEMAASAVEKFKTTSELLGVEMGYLLDRSPKNLSGGEKQRVAIGRCITRDPRLFLMDEPFSSLDAKLRETYRRQLKRLLSLYKVTTVYVTHDQAEAQVLADQVAVMRAGRIEQVGPYHDIYRSPVNEFVAGFVSLDTELPAINLLAGDILGPAYAGKKIGLRCEDIDVATAAGGEGIACELVQYRPSPMRADAAYQVKTLSGGQSVVARSRTRDGLAPGARLWLRPKAFHVFDALSGALLETVKS